MLHTLKIKHKCCCGSYKWDILFWVTKIMVWARYKQSPTQTQTSEIAQPHCLAAPCLAKLQPLPNKGSSIFFQFQSSSRAPISWHIDNIWKPRMSKSIPLTSRTWLWLLLLLQHQLRSCLGPAKAKINQSQEGSRFCSLVSKFECVQWVGFNVILTALSPKSRHARLLQH